MSEWDASTVEARDQRLARVDADGAPLADDGALTRRQALTRFARFLREYHDGTDYLYRQRLIQCYRKEDYFIDVDLDTLNHYDDHDETGATSLHDALRNQPNEYLPAFEEAALEVLGPQDPPPPGIQIVLSTTRTPMSIRDISAAEVNRLVTVAGIVISAARAKPKATSITIRCKQCNNTRRLPVGNSFGSVPLPRSCDGRTGPGAPDIGGQPCPLDPFLIVPDMCSYVDHQVLKLQEPPDLVPTGEMPRHILLSVDRSLVDRISPGTRVTVTGVASIFSAAGKRASRGSSGVSVRTPYIRVVGMATDDEGSGRTSTHFTHAEQEEFTRMAKDPDLYEKFIQSISPSISGDYTTDIKRAIACLLMGGSRKVLPDGMRLRGDINVLLLGDPSTAKSQFLKFVEKVAPVGVYTSGKGSSAAGLTASVVRDQKGEFHLEGGAMVLADGGVVCIDEFDKMREEDRVAIHEAMEQQTISVAKAGITTILNSRAAVLAAANPVFGRYDDEISAAENIDFLPTILSRFDLIFIVRDVRNYTRDRDIAKHVIGVHMDAADDAPDDDSADIDITTMKKYISYCRATCAPRLTQDAAESLMSQYVAIRADQRRHDSGESVIPITVRQLEALVRLSEALAKLNLKQEATAEHVREAIRLFRVSTLNAASAGIGDAAMSGDLRKEVLRVEAAIKRGFNIGTIRDTGSVKRELLSKGFSANAVSHAMRIMAQRQELQYVAETRRVRRLK